MKTNRCNHQLSYSVAARSQSVSIAFFKHQLSEITQILAALGIFLLSLFSSQAFAQHSSPAPHKDSAVTTPIEQTTDRHSSEQKDAWAFIHPYHARYVVSSDGDEIGHSNRKLSQSDNIWLLSTDASVSMYFLKMTSRELSRFAFVDNKLATLEFDSKTKISFKKERHMNQAFNWKTGLEVGKRDKKQWSLEHNKPAYDRVSHLIQMRADLLAGKNKLSYNVSYKGKLHDYQYLKQSEEIVATKMGELNTIKYAREKSNGDVFIIWLSPELNYFPVKIAQIEDDKPDITMTLESLSYQSNPQTD